MKSSDILIAAKSLIQREVNWNQGSMCRIRGINKHISTSRLGYSKLHRLGMKYIPWVYNFCSVGALEATSLVYDLPKDSLVRSRTFLNKVAMSMCDQDCPGLMTFNDTSSHETVMSVWDKAITAALEYEQRVLETKRVFDKMINQLDNQHVKAN